MDNQGYRNENLDQSNIVLALFFDFKKAFDCVNLVILLAKVSNYGVGGIAYDWFSSYLSDRKPYVSIHGSNSEKNAARIHLGSFAFLVFNNDFPK